MGDATSVCGSHSICAAVDNSTLSSSASRCSTSSSWSLTPELAAAAVTLLHTDAFAQHTLQTM